MKPLILLGIGGSVYVTIEVLFRGYSHWTMFLLGGICFICLGLINEVIPWDMKFWEQILIGDSIVVVLEFLTGCIVNLYLKWSVWDYSNLPFNLLGQICPLFAILWLPVVAFGIVLDDYVRWKIFGEEKPYYKLF